MEQGEHASVAQPEPSHEANAVPTQAGARLELTGLASALGNRAIQRLVRAGAGDPDSLEALQRPVAPAAVRAITRAVLARQNPPPGGGVPAPPAAPARRVILIDANVIDQINRGNGRAATALRDFARNADVYISQQAFNEAVVNPAIPRTATANRLMLEDLGIRVAPRGALADRVYVYERNALQRSDGHVGRGRRRRSAGSERERRGVVIRPCVPHELQLGADAAWRAGRA